MATLSLKIEVVEGHVTKTMQFDPTTIIFDACKIIRDRIAEAAVGNHADFGLFLKDEDPKKGVWLEARRTLDYYLLRNGDLLQYKKKHRILRVRMLDGSVKTLQVDDSHTVDQLMITICSRIGITNHDEYSLVRELSDDEREKTLTLKRDRSIAKDQKKLDEMKKKLHTDDELNWLDHSKTLREQAIEIEETLLLRRKFFFSDQNVDARDPVQLNLLYVQTRDAMLKGTHPVTQDEAMVFGGIQCQIQFGDHNEQKHKSGFIELKEFLPKEYLKVKGAEKKIYAEHRKVTGLTEIDAKVRYTQLARELKTYGITFFLVKEKMKGKNKLVPQLLGITKDSVVRLDAKTKEIKHTWPLERVRRWAASPNSFTLDFGDYSDSYYSVQTTEGEQISQLIAGYIDIILKKRKATDHMGIEGDEEMMSYEDNVSPAQAMIIQQQMPKVDHANMGSVALPAVLRAGGGGESQFHTGSIKSLKFPQVSNQAHSGHMAQAGQNAQMHGLNQAQRGLLSTIDNGLGAVGDASSGLDKIAMLPELGSDAASLQWRRDQEDMSKQNVGAQLSAMNAATAKVVTLTSADADDTDYAAVGSAVATISSNIGEFSKDMRMLAALQEEESDGDRLLDAARKLAGAFTDLLKAAQPGDQETPQGAFPRQNLLNAASRIGEASHDIMEKVGGEEEVDGMYEDTLISLAKAVANATAALVLKAKGVASKCGDQTTQNTVIHSATQCAMATSQLVACTKVVSPTIHNPSCQEQLIDSAKLVAKSVDGVMATAQSSCPDDSTLEDLSGAATNVTQALEDLLKHIRRTSHHRQHAQQEAPDGAVDTILTATDRLFTSSGDTGEMVKQARILAQATSKLVNALKLQAEEHTDSVQQKKLLAAAKQLADATARMVEAAKGCASNPADKDHQVTLREAAEDLRSATNTAATSGIKHRDIKRLEAAARYAASAATQLVNSAQMCIGKSNRSSIGQSSLTTQCKNVTDTIPRLVQGIKGTMNNPDSSAFHLALVHGASDLLQPGGKLVTACKAAAPTISDQAVQMSLNSATKNMAAALAELHSAVNKAQESCRTGEIDGALEQVRHLEDELDGIKQAAQAGQLRPLPGETEESSAHQLGVTSKTVGSSMAGLLTAAAQGNDNYTGSAARDTAGALKVLAQAVRGVAATTNDRNLQNNIIECARDIMDKSANLIEEAKKAVQNPNNPDNQTRLAQVAKAVSQALNNCVNCLPGLREVDHAVKHVTTISHRLTIKQYPSTNRSYQEVQTQMNNSAVTLNQAASDVINAARGAPPQVAISSNRFSKAYEDFVDSGLEFAGVTKNTETQTEIVSGLRSVSMTSSKLLVTTKTMLADPEAPNMKNLLANAARAVTDSINQLITICTTSAPGQKECDNALRQIQMMRNMLVNPSEAISDATYFECLDGVMHKSKGDAKVAEQQNLLQDLGDAMTGITNHAKNGELDDFCVSVRKFATAISGLTENSAQAAYLVGIADSASEPGRPGLVDQSQFSRANQAIQMVCQSFTNPAASKEQVLESAKIIANKTSMLCTTCKEASEKTNNQVAKRQFIESAKEVANCTARLVKVIKDLDGDFSDHSRQLCADASRPLINAVEELTTYASSPEFASVPAKISGEAREAQVPITRAGLSMIDGACHMLEAAKQLAVSPRDPPTYQRYSGYSKDVSDSIKKLLSAIKENAPGQRECEAAGSQIKQAIQALDQASMRAMNQSLEPSTGNSLQGYQDQMMNSARQLLEVIGALRDASKGKAQNLGHLAVRLGGYVEPLAQAAIGTASKTQNSKQQMMLLDQTKTVAEATEQLLFAAKESGGNPSATSAHNAINEASSSMQEMLEELLATMEQSASSAGNVSLMLDNISKTVVKMEEPIGHPGNKAFVDYQTNIVELAKQIAYTAQDMTGIMRTDDHLAQLQRFVVGKSGSNVSELGSLANSLTNCYTRLGAEARGAIGTSASREIGVRIKSTVKDLGTSCIDLVNDAGNLQADPTDSFAKQDLADHARQVSEKVSRLLASLQAGSRGTQACINAASTVSGIIGDLDTTIMFATAGTLNPDNDSDAFADHRESILKTAKSLVEDTKTLVTGAATNQEQLAAAAQSAVLTITRLADSVKHGAASLTSEQPEAQVLLINAVKDVASALGDLVSATKYASGKSSKDPAMATLSDSAKIMVRNVKSLLDTVKTVENEAARGTRALESSVDAIGQELRNFTSTYRVEKVLSAESLIRATKPITHATAKTVAAGNSCRQEDMIVAANLGRRAVHELLYSCKGAAAGAENAEIRQRALDAGRMCVEAYKQLLEQVNMIVQRPTMENKKILAQISQKVATAISELVHAAEAIKGMDWVDPDDPIVIAETQLLGAANAIEAAARKLEQLQPRRHVKAANENLSFEEQIVEAAKSIAAATGALIKAATAAQRELVAQGKVGAYTANYDEDNEWSQGLISAAKQVAGATQSLCDAANELIQGHASEEKLISSAKLVASNTARLLVACRVKADPDSAAMHRLQGAGNAVKRATDALVQAALAAKRGVTTYEEELTIEVNESAVGGMRQIITAREEILRKEKELEHARRRLETIYKSKYKDGQSEDEADDSTSSQF